MLRVFQHYWLITSISVVAWFLVWYYLGFEAFLITIILSILEITLSADNAVVNSRVLVKLSPFWQKMFLTVGIIIAVFLVRFVLPIFIVALAASLGISEVFWLALNNPEAYGHKLHEAAPMIDGFGGMFLFMVAMFFFLDSKRDGRWLEPLESWLAKFGSIRFSKAIFTAVVFGLILLAIPAELKQVVGVAMALGAATYAGLHVITLALEHFSDDKMAGKQQVGLAAFILFMYLQVLDASFSLDGVVGAFALTNNIVIIMVGLGVGAIWVRSMTIYMVRHETLSKYQFLESGAHWAIICLAMIMFLKLVHIELPEIVVGTIGLVFIAASVFSSVRREKSPKLSK